MQNISSYETKIQNHSSLTGDENSLQKTILVSNKNEKNIEFGIENLNCIKNKKN